MHRLIIVILLAAVALGSPAHAADRPSTGELDQRITAAAHRLEVIVEQYNESREDLRANLARQRTLGARIGPMTEDLRQRRHLMSGLAARAYQRTVRGPTVALFSADDPHEFVAKIVGLHELAAQQQRAVRDLDLARQRVAGTRITLRRLADQERRAQTQLSARKTLVEGEIAALEQMRRVAYSGGSRYAAVFRFPAPPDLAGAGGKVVAFAFAQLGKPYRWGATGPRAYDCSGLTLAAWERAGVSLPHNAARQHGATAHLDRSDIKPGDLVFFYGRISHVGVYIGDGMMIHAPEFGENIRIAPIDQQPIHGFGRPSSR
ncbi:C40 family peptidase [Actinoplanes sp. NPDC089786]|uniref:C40 family peptidase n=1 Tax=Actinoplanes sp. NPDC089786 TaxID=3155185 RepID=UPI003426DF53